MHTRRIKEDMRFWHLPSPVSTYITLCGWVDVEYEDVHDDSMVSCPKCCEIVRAAKKVPLKMLAR